MRVFVIDSDERREYEQKMRERSMQRVREKLEKLQRRVQERELTDAALIGAAAQRIMQAHHGHRYYRWSLQEGRFRFEEDPEHLGREKQIEGKYLIATSEPRVEAQEAVRMYKELSEVERGFRCLKDVLEMRPIYHRKAERVHAHIFVATLGLLLTRLLERRLKEAGIPLSAEQALQAAATISVVRFRLDQKRSRTGVTTGSTQARQVLKVLGIAETKPPTPPDDEQVAV